MAKNPHRPQTGQLTQAPAGQKSATVSKRGKKVIGAGACGVLLGFWVLTYADPSGQNWASTLSPALLVLGYALIGIGIVLPDSSPGI